MLDLGVGFAPESLGHGICLGQNRSALQQKETLCRRLTMEQNLYPAEIWCSLLRQAFRSL